jgi:hypothetical protein
MDMGINGLLGGYNAILRVTDNDGGATEEYVRFYCSPRIYIPVIGMADQISVINNPEAKDISYADLVTFLKKDDTDKAIYDSSKFVCADFAEQLQHRAEVTGIRCAFVEIEFVVGLHACNAFQTTDKGLVFIDDTGSSKSYHPHNMDTEVIVDKGKSYCPVALFYEGGWDSQYDCMGTVADYKIYWKGLYPIPVDSEDLVRIK